jgi:hypothetical protein
MNKTENKFLLYWAGPLTTLGRRPTRGPTNRTGEGIPRQQAGPARHTHAEQGRAPASDFSPPATTPASPRAPACSPRLCASIGVATWHYYKTSTHMSSLANNTCMYSTCTQHECCICFNAMFRWQCTWNDGAHVHVMLIWCTDARQTPGVL